MTNVKAEEIATLSAEEIGGEKRTSPQPKEGLKNLMKKNSIDSDYIREKHRLSTGEANIPIY